MDTHMSHLHKDSYYWWHLNCFSNINVIFLNPCLSWSIQWFACHNYSMFFSLIPPLSKVCDLGLNHTRLCPSKDPSHHQHYRNNHRCTRICDESKDWYTVPLDHIYCQYMHHFQYKFFRFHDILVDMYKSMILVCWYNQNFYRIHGNKAFVEC